MTDDSLRSIGDLSASSGLEGYRESGSRKSFFFFGDSPRLHFRMCGLLCHCFDWEFFLFFEHGKRICRDESSSNVCHVLSRQKNNILDIPGSWLTYRTSKNVLLEETSCSIFLDDNLELRSRKSFSIYGCGAIFFWSYREDGHFFEKLCAFFLRSRRTHKPGNICLGIIFGNYDIFLLGIDFFGSFFRKKLIQPESSKIFFRFERSFLEVFLVFIDWRRHISRHSFTDELLSDIIIAQEKIYCLPIIFFIFYWHWLTQEYCSNTRQNLDARAIKINPSKFYAFPGSADLHLPRSIWGNINNFCRIPSHILIFRLENIIIGDRKIPGYSRYLSFSTCQHDDIFWVRQWDASGTRKPFFWFIWRDTGTRWKIIFFPRSIRKKAALQCYRIRRSVANLHPLEKIASRRIRIHARYREHPCIRIDRHDRVEYLWWDSHRVDTFRWISELIRYSQADEIISRLHDNTSGIFDATCLTITESPEVFEFWFIGGCTVFSSKINTAGSRLCVAYVSVILHIFIFGPGSLWCDDRLRQCYRSASLATWRGHHDSWKGIDITDMDAFFFRIFWIWSRSDAECDIIFYWCVVDIWQITGLERWCTFGSRKTPQTRIIGHSHARTKTWFPIQIYDAFIFLAGQLRRKSALDLNGGLGHEYSSKCRDSEIRYSGSRKRSRIGCDSWIGDCSGICLQRITSCGCRSRIRLYGHARIMDKNLTRYARLGMWLRCDYEGDLCRPRAKCYLIRITFPGFCLDDPVDMTEVLALMETARKARREIKIYLTVRLFWITIKICQIGIFIKQIRRLLEDDPDLRKSDSGRHLSLFSSPRRDNRSALGHSWTRHTATRRYSSRISRRGRKRVSHYTIWYGDFSRDTLGRIEFIPDYECDFCDATSKSHSIRIAFGSFGAIDTRDLTRVIPRLESCRKTRWKIKIYLAFWLCGITRKRTKLWIFFGYIAWLLERKSYIWQCDRFCRIRHATSDEHDTWDKKEKTTAR